MKALKKLVNRMLGISHLFAKAIIVHCVLCGTAFSYYTLRIMSRTGRSAAAELGIIMGFFGGELLLLCLRTVLNEKKPNTKTDEKGDEPGKGDAE